MADYCGRAGQTQTLVAAMETSPGSGAFGVDERLRVDEVTLLSDEHISTARLSVRLDNDFDTAAARARYLPDSRVVIRTDEADPAGRVVLFEGTAPVQEASWRGEPGKAKESFGFTAVHVYERLARDRRSWVYGRRMRSGAIEDGLIADPAAWSDQSVLVEALPCVFNLDGARNCSPTPLKVVSSDGQVRSIHIFTYDNDANGIPWTYAKALRYLAWFYAPREGPVRIDGVLDATEETVISTASSRLATRLSVLCDTLMCEAANLVESLALLADAAGVHVTADTTADGESVRTRLRVWAAGDGVRKQLHLARGGVHADGVRRYDASELRAADVLRANEVVAADIRWDYQRIVNAPIVIGGVKAYEMTVPLVPGWLPTEHLDNVAPQDRTAAKELALTPEQVDKLGDLAEQSEWFRRYHRRGSEFGRHRYVGRLWVLNEDGRFDAATYNRNAPFDDYRPFEFSTVAEPEIARLGSWSRRSRSLLGSVTRSESGGRYGVHVEVSFDGGVNWYVPSGAITVLKDPAGIVFEVTNPTQITPPGIDPVEQNPWFAMIDQSFCVRVTAVIESDERLLARPDVNDSSSPTLLATSGVTARPSAYRFVSREGTTNVLADVNSEEDDIEVDDTEAIERFARGLAERGQDRRVIASPVVPRLDTAFSIGDEIERIHGRGVSFLTREDGAAVGPVVVGKRFRTGGGRWDTELLLEHSDAPVSVAGGV
jgi:hypothetical protein